MQVARGIQNDRVPFICIRPARLLHPKQISIRAKLRHENIRSASTHQVRPRKLRGSVKVPVT
jgi:hypothetical protein